MCNVAHQHLPKEKLCNGPDCSMIMPSRPGFKSSYGVTLGRIDAYCPQSYRFDAHCDGLNSVSKLQECTNRF